MPRLLITLLGLLYMVKRPCLHLKWADFWVALRPFKGWMLRRRGLLKSSYRVQDGGGLLQSHATADQSAINRRNLRACCGTSLGLRR